MAAAIDAAGRNQIPRHKTRIQVSRIVDLFLTPEQSHVDVTLRAERAPNENVACGGGQLELAGLQFRNVQLKVILRSQVTLEITHTVYFRGVRRAPEVCRDNSC